MIKAYLDIKRPSTKDRRTQVRPPSPIFVKMGSVVGFDPKVTHEALFLTFGLRNPVIWASEGQIFGFLKKHVLGRKSVQEWSRTDPKAPLEAKLRKRSPRVEILRLQEETTEVWPTTSQECAINKSFLYAEISQKFQREVNAWAISYI